VSSWTEPEWDDESRELLIAEDMVSRLTGQNGEWMPEATSEDANPNNYSGYRYVADGPHTNWAEKARLQAIEMYKKAVGDDPDLSGLYWTVKKIDWGMPSLSEPGPDDSD